MRIEVSQRASHLAAGRQRGGTDNRLAWSNFDLRLSLGKLVLVTKKNILQHLVTNEPKNIRCPYS